MKKSILLAFAIIALALVSQAQTAAYKSAYVGKVIKSVDSIATPDPVVKDTIIQITMHVNQFRQLLSSVDQNIDSKKVTRDLLEFLQRSAQIVQPADKPKNKE